MQRGRATDVNLDEERHGACLWLPTKYPHETPYFLAQICPRHVVSFISVLAKKSAHKVFCGARAPRGHATRSSCTVRAGKSMVSRYRRSRCVPRSISWPGTKVASTRRVSPSKGKSTR